MPQQWKSKWIEAKDYSKQDAINYLTRKKEDYQLLDINGLITYLKGDLEFEPKDYVIKAFQNTDTIIEFIGNKWILNLRANRAGSNKNFLSKKSEFHSCGLVIPFNNKKLGIDSYDNWSSQEILARSLDMINHIYEAVINNNEYDSF